MNTEKIKENTRNILAALPKDITLVAAAKSRTPEEVEAVIRAVVSCITVTSGIRIGTAALISRGFKEAEMATIV
jgi:hypothetical protein